MDPPHPPPASTTTTTPENTHFDQLPPVPTNTSKLRLMCSYGGHIVPRPSDKSLFYANGETRIVAIDRRTTAATLSSLVSHLSRTLFNNRPFHLKYQLPNEDLDSLISVTTDEDLSIMLEEHDRVSTVTSPKSTRIRLFLFPVKPESVGSALLDQKAESWFSDALKNTGVVQRGQSADSCFVHGLMGLDIVTGTMDSQVEEGNNGTTKNVFEIGGGGGGGGAGAECMVLETSSSFGSTSSSVSMSNLPPIGTQCEESDKKVRVSSSASLESDNGGGSAVFQEPPTQVAPGPPSFTIESENIVFDPSSMIQMQKAVQVSGQLQHEVQYIHGSPHYIPQYSTGPLQQAPYYPMYQIPMHQQQHSPYSVNQQYPVYLVPVHSAQSYNMPMHSNINNNLPIPSTGLPPHPQTATIIPPMIYKEIMTTQPVPKSVPKVDGATPLGPPELTHPSQTASVEAASYTSELDDNLAYTQIYKSQPPAPVLPSQFQITTKNAPVLVSESAMPTNVK